jgi:heme oxygenase
MESGLVRLATSPVIGPLAQAPIYRSAALAADLRGLAGASWRQSLRLLPSARQYAERIAAVAAEGNGERLLAHAYVRYMGDLNGGRVLARLLARNLGLEAAALSFYEFPGIADIGAFKHAYRATIDDAADEIDDVEGLLLEARTAFEMNIAVSEAVLPEALKRSQASA